MSNGNSTTQPDRATYLEPSQYEVDGGRSIGKTPRSVSLSDLQALGCPKSPIKAIRAKCLDCSCNDKSEIRKCTAVFCALWPFRMAVNPFHASARLSNVEEGVGNE